MIVIYCHNIHGFTYGKRYKSPYSTVAVNSQWVCTEVSCPFFCHGFTYVELKGDWGNSIVLCCCPQIYSCTYTTIPQWSLQIYHFELNVPPVVALDAYSSASHLTCVCYDVIRWFLAKSYQGTCVWSGRQCHPFNVWWFGFTHASNLQSIVRISLM